MICLPLYDAPGLTVEFAPELAGAEADFAALLGERVFASGENTPVVRVSLGLLAKAPAGACFILKNSFIQLVFQEATQRYEIYLNPAKPLTAERKSLCFRCVTVCSLLSGILAGYELIPIHGALLEYEGQGILLCGTGGVGKSTSMRRWQTCGGTAYADDMVLLEVTGSGGFMATPLPTWSRCQQGMENLCYPAAHKVPLVRLFGIERSHSGVECIVPVASHEYTMAVYSALFLHLDFFVQHHPEGAQNSLIANLKGFARRISDVFPPRAFLADLNADIRATLTADLK